LNYNAALFRAETLLGQPEQVSNTSAQLPWGRCLPLPLNTPFEYVFNDALLLRRARGCSRPAVLMRSVKEAESAIKRPVVQVSILHMQLLRIEWH
jgi:hypothetical protein